MLVSVHQAVCVSNTCCFHAGRLATLLPRHAAFSSSAARPSLHAGTEWGNIRRREQHGRRWSLRRSPTVGVFFAVRPAHPSHAHFSGTTRKETPNPRRTLENHDRAGTPRRGREGIRKASAALCEFLGRLCSEAEELRATVDHVGEKTETHHE